MRGIGALIRLERWQLVEKRRALAALEKLKSELEQRASHLSEELRAEQGLAAASDEGRYAYPGYASAVIAQREALSRSLDEISRSIESARDDVARAFERVKSYEQTEARDRCRRQAEMARREGARLDEIGGEMHRRRRREEEARRES